MNSLPRSFEELDTGRWPPHPGGFSPWTMVCSRWRSVAMHVPAISVVSNQLIQLTKTYLGRSCNQPLDLHFEWWIDEGIWKGPLRQRLTVLMSYSRRWRRLSLTKMNARNIHSVLSRVNNLGYFPQLTHLTVHKSVAIEEFRRCFPFIAVISTPAL